MTNRLAFSIGCGTAQRKPDAFLYAFDLLELDGDRPAPKADRGAQGLPGQHPA